MENNFENDKDDKENDTNISDKDIENYPKNIKDGIENYSEISFSKDGKYLRDDIKLKELPTKRSGIASIFNVHEPRVRLNGITNSSKMRINFNNNMVLPPNFKEIISENRRNLQVDEEPMVQIESLAGEDSDLEELNLDWELTQADETGLSFKIKYKNPL